MLKVCTKRHSFTSFAYPNYIGIMYPNERELSLGQSILFEARFVESLAIFPLGANTYPDPSSLKDCRMGSEYPPA